RYRFVKTFIDSDKITKFLSVIENDKGEFIGITATPIKNTDLKNLLKGDIIWGGDTLSTLSTPQIAKQEVEAISETIPNQSIKEAETTAKNQANLAKPIAKEPTPQAKQETQATKEADIKADKKAKLDEELAKNKAYVEGLEREAINKIEALHNLSKTKAERIPLKSIISQAEQELKEFARLRAKETGASQERINNVKIKSLDDLKNHLDSLGLYIAKTKDKEGEALLNKYVEILNDISEARLNQRAIKKQNETQKDDLIKGVVDSLKGLQIVGLRNLSNFLTKYGKTDEFMTKANPKWKSEFDKARALMERDQNITPIKEFGTNYAEFYRDGENAIKKLLTERQGQVAGAFYKDGRDITISWGEAKMANGDIKGYGLSKIEAKHLNDFAIFEGSTPQEKMANGINEIIEKGKIVSDDGIDTIWYKKGDRAYVVGLSKGFNGVGDTSWVVTSYEKKNVVGDSKALSANAKFNEIKSPISTNTETIPNQSIKEAETAKDLTADAPSELYKAHRKAQKAKEAPKSQEPQATKQAETTTKEPTQPQPNTNSRLEKIKKFIQGKTNKALDSEIKTYNELYRYVLDDFAKAHPDELNLPKYASEMANYITKEFLVKHDKEIKEIIAQKTSGENRQIVLNAFENLKQNFDELRSVGIGDLRKPTAKDIKDKIAEIEIKSMSDKELVTQFQKLKDSKARVNENLYKYLENEIKKREKKLYPFINSDKKDYSYDLEKQLKNRGLMGLKDSELENIAKERNSILYLPSYIRENVEQELNIKPIKEFGTNYAEFYHDGKGAIDKLLIEKQGQVAGAFEREELGDIDLVWGNEKMGLAHILARRSEQWGEEKAIRFINHLAENIEKGTINAGKNGRVEINTELTTIVIDKNKDNRFILTAYRDKNNKKMSLENAKLVQSSTITDKGIETNAKDSSVLLSNQQPNSTPKEIKSQELTTQPKWANKFKTKMAKMGQEYNDEKIANLANWHKDSHAVTKESDGSPKLF
ncbi:MAG: hypothetical protein SPI11_05710, partial [Campylobacter lanienae]|nr:hypothetical protein [Campylobacter lanienae]